MEGGLKAAEAVLRAARAAEQAALNAKKLAIERAKKKPVDKVNTTSNKAVNSTKKTGNPVQKDAQAKANPKGSSARSSGGGGKSSGSGSKPGGSTGASSRNNGGSSGGGGAGKADGGSCRTSSNSFTPDTEVLMADGSTKPIKDVKPGDKVLATDPETGETRVETVTAEITGDGVKHLVKVTIDTDGEQGTKTAEVTATDGHPFWVPELGEWIDATDLQPGQWLQTSAGTWVQITAIQRWTTDHAVVHNLTVANTHTYYVLAGTTPILVHNCGGEVEIYIPEWATDEEVKQFMAYVAAANEALDMGLLSPTGRVSTKGAIRQEAEKEAKKERARAAAAGTPYKGVAGHGPDAMWLGHGRAYRWIDMTRRVNSSLSAQQQRYPVGYIPTRFVLVDGRK